MKTKKTAGTSLETHLSQYLTGPDDIITPHTPEDEFARAKLNIYPKNYAAVMAMSFWNPDPTEKNHIPADKLVNWLPQDVWGGYIKVTSERHPYEKAVSLTWFRLANFEQNLSFAQCLDKTVASGVYKNFHRYSIDGRVVADIILRYEHLLGDTNRFLSSVGLPATDALPTAKTRFRQDRRPAREVLSPEQKKHIQVVCAEEFAYFHYEP